MDTAGSDMAVKKKSKWRVALKVFIALVFLVMLLLADFFGIGGLLVPITGDAMDWKAHYVAGFLSKNCGRVKVRQDPSLATACALDANSEARSFRVIYNVQGFDSTVAGGIARSADGKLLALSFDGCPMGCGFSFLAQRAIVHACPQPYHLYTNPNGRLNCFQPQPAGPQNTMSPNIEPY